MFTDDIIFTAIKNNALWVLIVPAAVTAVGLIFAVLTERVWWATAFKIAVFIPLAVSLFAVGVIWRIMYERDPDQGAINAMIVGVQEAFEEPGVLSARAHRRSAVTGSTESGLHASRSRSPPAARVTIGLTRSPPREVPEDAPDAAPAGAGRAAGSPASCGGTSSREAARRARSSRASRASAASRSRSSTPAATRSRRPRREADGSFVFDDVESGQQYRVKVDSVTFAAPFTGFNWLGEKLITPSIMFAYLWVQAGFAMVIIAAGLAAIPRDVLEAARTDGGTEWQVFRRVTVPLLAPVLTVVLVTQVIGVLKLFDLILAIAPAPSRPDATTLAFEMWRRSFSGQNLFGLGSAIATFLFVLFIPFLVINIRRFRAEAR